MATRRTNLIAMEGRDFYTIKSNHNIINHSNQIKRTDLVFPRTIDLNNNLSPVLVRRPKNPPPLRTFWTTLIDVPPVSTFFAALQVGNFVIEIEWMRTFELNHPFSVLNLIEIYFSFRLSCIIFGRTLMCSQKLIFAQVVKT